MARKPRMKEESVPTVERLHAAPKGLDRVLGQERALGTLQSSMASGRLHHAWIFHGPTGVGKMTTALSLAATLLDPTSTPDLGGVISPEPESVVQSLLAAGSHPDLHVIVKELARFSSEKTIRDRKLISIPLEVIRQRLLEPAALAANLPGGSGGMASKVFIVDEAHLLNGPTQNALLKTLEEPPEGTVLILVTDSEERLLPTVRSRCQRVAFEPLGEAEMGTWLKEWLAGLDETIESGDMEWLLGYAAGSPGRFVEAHAAGLAGWARVLEADLVQAEAGRLAVGLGKAMLELVSKRAERMVEVDRQASKDAANKVASREMFRMLAERARSGMVSDTEGSMRRVELIQRAEEESATNVSLAFVFDHLAAGWAAGLAAGRSVGMAGVV